MIQNTARDQLGDGAQNTSALAFGGNLVHL